MITTSDDVAIDVTDEGAGTPIVLVGGFGMGMEGWGSVRGDLLAAGTRVVCVDRRSHGRSAHVTHGQDLRRHGADVGEALHALGIEGAIWVGASMGAAAGWAWIDQAGTDLLAGVVSVDQTPAMLPCDDWDLGMTGLDRAGLDGFIATFPGDLNPFHRMPDPAVLAVLADAPPLPIEDLRGLLREHAEADWRPVIASLDVPVLAIAGRQSPFWPWQHAEAIAELAPDGSVAVIEDCGHAVQLEQPAALVDALLGFVRDLHQG